MAGASRRNDTGRKLDAIDLSGQRYVNAYDRPISVLTPPLELTIIVAFASLSSAYLPIFSFSTVFHKVSHAGEQTSPFI